jgi:2-succinyl-5-enolpyruvyl-6-hydroxy-3-cyclohexene-1-carboxylate synthase
MLHEDPREARRACDRKPCAERADAVSEATDTFLLLRAFVDELARSGMRAACTAPGSRSAPLVISLAREPRLRCYSHVDERCAGFFALGLAKASGLPVAVACTSGTAAAELLPAAIEAREARVPLLLLTADRPPELRESGAGQTIDQLKLYGGAAKWFFEVGTHEVSADSLAWIRTLACRAYATALEGRPGVVHLNFPLREPLVPDGTIPHDDSGRRDGRPFVARTAAAAPVRDPVAAPLVQALAGARRGVIVAGRDERLPPAGETSVAELAAQLAQSAGWPLLADPLSGARRGDAAIAHYDASLRSADFRASVQPDLVLRIGDLPTSKPLRGWLAGLRSVRQVALDPEGAWQDPDATLADSLALDARIALRAAVGSVAPADEEWLSLWRSADERAAEAILGTLASGELSEPAVATELGVLLPACATLFVSSSMPVRDIESFWPARDDPPRVLCNRGANGIDGVVSSAFGAAAASRGPTVLMIGDVALAHDIGGLLAARRLGLRLVIVLLDNGGGGIFDFLPIAGAKIARQRDPREREGEGEDKGEDLYTHHVATPTGLDFAAAAGLYGLSYEHAHDVQDFRGALERALADGGTTMIHVQSERAGNVRLHVEVWDAVARALSRVPDGRASAADTAR